MSKNVVRINSKGVVTVGLTRLGEGVPNLTDMSLLAASWVSCKPQGPTVKGPLPLLPLADRPTWMD